MYRADLSHVSYEAVPAPALVYEAIPEPVPTPEGLPWQFLVDWTITANGLVWHPTHHEPADLPHGD